MYWCRGAARAVDRIAAQLLADAWLPWPRDGDVQLLRRLRFAGRDVGTDSLVRTAAYGARSLDDVHIGRALAADVARDLDRDAPESLAVPSGRHVPLAYNEEDNVSA